MGQATNDVGHCLSRVEVCMTGWGGERVRQVTTEVDSRDTLHCRHLAFGELPCQRYHRKGM